MSSPRVTPDSKIQLSLMMHRCPTLTWSPIQTTVGFIFAKPVVQIAVRIDAQTIETVHRNSIDVAKTNTTQLILTTSYGGCSDLGVAANVGVTSDHHRNTLFLLEWIHGWFQKRGGTHFAITPYSHNLQISSNSDPLLQYRSPLDFNLLGSVNDGLP